MKRKEIKDFEKKFKKLTDSGKKNIISALFETWTKEFEKTSKRSPKEVLGFMQRCSMWWKELHSSLPPFSSGHYITDYAFAEYFSQVIDYLSSGIHPRSHVDNLIRVMGFDPKEVRRGLNEGEKTFTINYYK